MFKEHEKIHETFPCEDCGMEFKYEAILEKHMGAHEHKLFCHYHSNDKECPCEDKCIFLHEESENYKHGKQCERELCMYRLDKNSEDVND